MAGIFWLASYPKSGNTWMRIFLSNLAGQHEKPVDINSPHGNEIASSRLWLDHLLGFDTADMTPDEIEAVRPECHAWASSEAVETAFHKIHDANVVSSGGPLIRPGTCRGVLYMLRNPLDVAPSAASHWGDSIDDAIRRLNTPDAVLLGAMNRPQRQVRQRLLDWSGHVHSWVDDSGLDVHVVRYEDLLADPFTHFGAAARFLGLPDDEADLRRAIHNSRFDELARQEETGGFRERSKKADRFFRSGRAGDWREALDADQVDRIVHAHADTMRRFGYLDSAGRPT
jgi:hypothetical protein